MEGNYRLFRQGGGRGAFAHVYVQVIPWDGMGKQVIVALMPDSYPIPATGPDSEWYTAAEDGCRLGLEALESQGVRTEKFRVQVIKLIENPADTRADAVRTSACLATLQAFGLDRLFRPVFKQEWQVELFKPDKE